MLAYTFTLSTWGAETGGVFEGQCQPWPHVQDPVLKTRVGCLLLCWLALCVVCKQYTYTSNCAVCLSESLPLGLCGCSRVHEKYVDSLQNLCLGMGWFRGRTFAECPRPWIPIPALGKYIYHRTMSPFPFLVFLSALSEDPTCVHHYRKSSLLSLTLLYFHWPSHTVLRVIKYSLSIDFPNL